MFWSLIYMSCNVHTATCPVPPLQDIYGRWYNTQSRDVFSVLYYYQLR